MPRSLPVTPSDEPSLPLFVRIARGISEDIARGRFRAGQKLPGTRALARELSVHRNTVVAAFEELESQGWIQTEPARGSFVTDVRALDRMPKLRPPRPSIPENPAFDFTPPGGLELPAAPPPRGMLMLHGGLPDLRLFPTEVLSRAYRRALRSSGAELLDYADPRGDSRLRAALSDMLSDSRRLAARPENIVVTQGAQQALWLIARTLIRRGDTVLVEAQGYPPAWAALRDQGARLVAVPVDAHGVQVDAVERELKRRRVRALYLTPHHQYPTMAVLHPARRARLLELAKAHGTILIEDDYDSEYHFEGRPVLPMASADRSGSVLYVGTLSKVLAPGLRIGYVAAPRSVAEALSRRRLPVDRQGNALTERAVAELLEDGELQRHAWRMRREYEGRRAALVHALDKELQGRVRFEVPPGGLSLWVRALPPLDVTRWAKRSEELGVHFLAGHRFAFDGRCTGHARIGFARLDEAELARAVRILRRAADDVCR